MSEMISGRRAKKSWLRIQDNLRTNLKLEKSFKHSNEIHKVQEKLNSANWKSEMAFEKTLLNLSEKYNFSTVKFRKNFPILNKYFGDFVSIHHKVIVELDGSIHKTNEQKQKDLLRDQILRSAGWTVFRISYPSFDGINEFISWLMKHKMLPKPTKQAKPKKNQNKKIKRIKKPKNEKPNLLIGCKNDRSVRRNLRAKRRQIERARQSYIRAGLDADKMLKMFNVN